MGDNSRDMWCFGRWGDMKDICWDDLSLKVFDLYERVGLKILNTLHEWGFEDHHREFQLPFDNETWPWNSDSEHPRFKFKSIYPYTPCMVYLPTFGWFLGQMLINIPYMEYMAYGLYNRWLSQFFPISWGQMDVQPSRSDPLGPLRPALATGCNGGCLDETSGWAKGFGWKVKLVCCQFLFGCLVVL